MPLPAGQQEVRPGGARVSARRTVCGKRRGRRTVEGSADGRSAGRGRPARETVPAGSPRAPGRCVARVFLPDQAAQSCGTSWPPRLPAGPERQALDLAPQFGERLGEDRLAVRVAAPLPHIGEVRLVGLGARRVRGLSRSCPAGKPQRGQSQVSGTCASLAKLGTVSCPLEHQKEMRRRGADSPRSASPIGPAPTRLPRIALPLATVVTPCVMVPRSESAFRFAASASVYVRPNARPVIGVTAPTPGRKPHDRPRSAARTEHGALRTGMCVPVRS